MCDEEKTPSLTSSPKAGKKGDVNLWKTCLLYKVRLCFVDAQTLDATARLTNVNFTADLQNSSSQAYKNLTASIIEEVSTLQGLSSDRLYRISHKAYFIVSSTQAS